MEDFGYPGTPVEFVDEFRARNISVPCNLDYGSGSEVNWLAVIVGAAVGGVVVIGACLAACFCWARRNQERMILRQEAGSVELKQDSNNFLSILTTAPNAV
jgi:hypothetical protein